MAKLNNMIQPHVNNMNGIKNQLICNKITTKHVDTSGIISTTKQCGGTPVSINSLLSNLDDE